MAQSEPLSNDNDSDDISKTYYEILELTQTATLQDVKKAYRRLALLHHPDRNPPEKQARATVLFRRVNEAYEVLSDPEQRRQYDLELRSGGAGKPAFYHPGSSSNFHQHRPHGSRHHYHPYRDPFERFNDLFSNDPFFQEAFKDMDDLFAKTFQEQHPQHNRAMQPTAATTPPAKKSWGRWIADCLGIDFQISTTTTTIGADGRPIKSTMSQTHYGGGGNTRQQQQQHRSTYTSRSTRTVIENGQRVTIQSLEKDGNKIEEKYVNNQLVQRLINGIPEQQYRLGHGGGRDTDL